MSWYDHMDIAALGSDNNAFWHDPGDTLRFAFISLCSDETRDRLDLYNAEAEHNMWLACMPA
jgi:hypothetical protein